MASDTFFTIAVIGNRAQQAMLCQQNPLACCFERAVHMLIAMRTLPNQTPSDGRWRLCHGALVKRLGRRKTTQIVYAWLENEGVVFDPTAGKLYPKADYYTAGHIVADAVVIYTVKTAQKAMLEHAGTDWENGPFAPQFIHAIAKDGLSLETYDQPQALVPLLGLKVGDVPKLNMTTQ